MTKLVAYLSHFEVDGKNRDAFHQVDVHNCTSFYEDE